MDVPSPELPDQRTRRRRDATGRLIPVPPPPPVGAATGTARSRVRSRLTSPDGVREAFLLLEILGPPGGLHRPR